MNKPLSFLSAGVSLTLAFSSMPSHALDAWELYQQAKPDQVGVIAASKMAREQCTKENEATPCNNIGNVLRVFRKQIKTFFYEGGGTPEQNQLYDEGKLWCPLFRDTEQAIALYAETDKETKGNFKNNLDEIKNKYHITTLTRLNADRIINIYNQRKMLFVKMEINNNRGTSCTDYIRNSNPVFDNIINNKYEANNQTESNYIGDLSEIDYDIRMYSYYEDNNRPTDALIASFNKTKNTQIGIQYNRTDDYYQPKSVPFPFRFLDAFIVHDLYSRLGDTISFQHRQDIPIHIKNAWLKNAHASAPLNPIITAQYLDSLIASKNQNELAITKRYLEGIAHPLINAENKSGISKLQDRRYFGNPRFTNSCTINRECSADEIGSIGKEIKKMLEASELLRQKSELYEAAAKQIKIQNLPNYYENYFLESAAKYSKYSVELKWNTDQWRDLAKQAAKLGSSGNYGQTDMDSSTNQSYIGNNAEQSGEGASSNFNRMIESSRPYLKGKDLQRLNQYQNGMDLLNSIMGQ